MKKLSLVIVFAVALAMTTAVNTSAAETSEEFVNYKIESVNDLHVGKNIEKIWTLTYSADEVPVTVLKRKTASATNYIVRSEYFEVCYTSNADGFGVEKIKKSWANVPAKITEAVISEKDMLNQKVITPKKVDDDRALALIANYLPELVNDTYTHLLN